MRVIPLAVFATISLALLVLLPGRSDASALLAPFESCADARAAGAAPLKVSDPGYQVSLDADKDGIACEDIPDPSTIPSEDTEPSATPAATPSTMGSPTPSPSESTLSPTPVTSTSPPQSPEPSATPTGSPSPDPVFESPSAGDVFAPSLPNTGTGVGGMLLAACGLLLMGIGIVVALRLLRRRRAPH